jgi:hypothetical protein
MKKRHLILLILIAALAFLVFGSFLPAIGKKGTSPEAASMVRLRQFAHLVHEYASEHDGILPDALSWHEVMDPWIGIDRNDPIYKHRRGLRGDLLLLPIPWADRRVPAQIANEELANIPFMYEDPELFPKRTSVAFWDGSVRTISDEEFVRLIDTTNAVRLGPRDPKANE